MLSLLLKLTKIIADKFSVSTEKISSITNKIQFRLLGKFYIFCTFFAISGFAFLFSVAASQAQINPLGSVSNSTVNATTAPSCPGADFVIPAAGNLGWTYKDPSAHTGLGSTPPDDDYSTPINPANPTRDKHSPVEAHTGIDIWNYSTTPLPVYAAYDGVVSDRTFKTSTKVIITHNDIKLDTYYTHIERDLSIKNTGQKIFKGDKIGVIYGANGHLHFSIKAINADESHLPNTKDPSIYLNANVNHEAGALDTVNFFPPKRPVSAFCFSSVRGRVLEPNGNPSTGATVKASSINGAIIKTAITNNDGYYQLYINTGNVSITASKYNVGYGGQAVNIQPNISNSAPDIKLQINSCQQTLSTGNFISLKSLISSDLNVNLCGSGASYDNAQFISDQNYPDGSVVTAGQSLTKSWRMKNTGTSSWGTGYKLCFIRGEQLGSSSCIDAPVAAPGQTVNINLPVQIPANIGPGGHKGYWRLKNPGGTYFGDEIWYSFTVSGTQPTGGNGVTIELVSVVNPPQVSPNQQFIPEVTVRVTSGQLLQSRADMLRFTGPGFNYTSPQFPHVAVVGTVNTGQTYTFRFYSDKPFQAPGSVGSYTSGWKVWANSAWAGPDIPIKFSVFTIDTGRPPNKPSNLSPGNWSVFNNQMPQLCAQNNGDPDGDAITGYFFQIFDSGQNWDSGWVSNCITPPNLGNYLFKWHVKVRDSRGKESEWSDPWNFNNDTTVVTINNFRFDPGSPSNAATVKIWFEVGGCNGTINNITIHANEATDGSTNGKWVIITTGLAVTHYDETNVPKWDTRDLAEGTHVVRVDVTSCDGTHLVKDYNYVLTRGIPSHPYLIAPAHQFWSTSRTIKFSWQPALRVNSYRLTVGTTEDPRNAPVFEIVTTATEYTYTFNQEYSKLWWRVSADNEFGSDDLGGRWVGIDQTPPVTSISVDRTGAVSYETQVPIAWDAADPLSGSWTFDVQYTLGQDNQWQDWLKDYPYTSAIFNGQPGQVYCFRSRGVDLAGNGEAYPNGADHCVNIDPTKRPAQSWWNSAYKYKRTVLVTNLMSDRALPENSPVLLHFDQTTNPTAADIYNESKAANKGDDVRLVVNDTQDNDRYIKTFTPTAIDIWFNTVSLPAGSNTNIYSLYYGNPAAPIPYHYERYIMAPRRDVNTNLLMYFNEGSGSVANDQSDYGNHGTFDGSGFVQPWPTGKIGSGLKFNENTKISVPDSPSLQITGPMTIEAWVRPTVQDSAYRNVAAKINNPYKDDAFRLFIIEGDPTFEVFKGTSSKWVNANQKIPVNQWTHLAGVYDGSSLHIFINGVRVRDVAYNQGINAGVGSTLWIGSTGQNFQHFIGDIDQVRISNIARFSFPYATVTINPISAAGQTQTEVKIGPSDLKIQNLQVSSGPNGEQIVQATITNESITYPTYNQFYINLYKDYTPTGPGDFTNSTGFWVNSPIDPGATVTVSSVLTGITPNSLKTNMVATQSNLAPITESSYSLSAQVDTTGVVLETDKTNNILPAVKICSTTADPYEGDDLPAQARNIGQPEVHNLHRPGDQDWYKFSSSPGMTSVIATSVVGTSADTVLSIYGSDGTTLLAQNDDFGGGLSSRITFIAPSAGDYYIKVTGWNPNSGGCGTSYKIGYSFLKLVTSSTDDGQGDMPGTLSFWLLNTPAGQGISFAMPGNTINITGALPPVPPGVELFGSCYGGPGVIINGLNASDGSDGLTLLGNNKLTGIKVMKFPGKQIVTVGTGNKLSCVSVSKT